MLSNTGFSQALSAIPYRYEPGSIWQYSRATDLLGALLERVTGMALGTICKRTSSDPWAWWTPHL